MPIEIWTNSIHISRLNSEPKCPYRSPATVPSILDCSVSTSKGQGGTTPSRQRVVVSRTVSSFTLICAHCSSIAPQYNMCANQAYTMFFFFSYLCTPTVVTRDGFSVVYEYQLKFVCRYTASRHFQEHFREGRWLTKKEAHFRLRFFLEEHFREAGRGAPVSRWALINRNARHRREGRRWKRTAGRPGPTRALLLLDAHGGLGAERETPFFSLRHSTRYAIFF